MAQVRYDWDKWFASRRLLRLERGTHFAVTPAIMAQQVRNAARRYNVSVSIRTVGECLILSVTR